MNKKEIVSKFFERGVLLCPDVLEKITLETEIPPSQLVLTHLPQKPEAGKAQLTVKDVADFYREKYEGIKEMLLKRLSPTSISSAKKNFAEVSIIGMVREKSPAGFIMEDPTGEMEIVTQLPLEAGDVVGMTGLMREGRLVAEEIVYPDIPLPKQVKKVDVSISFTAERLEGEGEQVVWGEGRNEGNVFFISRNPAKLSVGGVEILVFEGEGNPVDWLKKRHLPGKVISPKDPFLIETVPDILWVIANERKVEIYKGVTIIKTDRKSFVRINMATQGVEFGDV